MKEKSREEGENSKIENIAQIIALTGKLLLLLYLRD
jgi:hypothetical protein